jgi:hypothetical protein
MSLYDVIKYGNQIASEIMSKNRKQSDIEVIESFKSLSKLTDVKSKISMQLHKFTSLSLLADCTQDLPKEYYNITNEPMLMLPNEKLDEFWFSVIDYFPNGQYIEIEKLLCEYSKLGKEIFTLDDLPTKPRSLDLFVESDVIEYKLLEIIQQVREEDVNYLNITIPNLKLEIPLKYQEMTIDEISNGFKDSSIHNNINNIILKKKWNLGYWDLTSLIELAEMYHNEKNEILFLKLGFYSSKEYCDLLNFSVRLSEIYSDKEDYHNALIWLSISKGYNDSDFNPNKTDLNKMFLNIFKSMGDISNAFTQATRILENKIANDNIISKKEYLEIIHLALEHLQNKDNYSDFSKTISLSYTHIPDEIEKITNKIGNNILKENDKLIQENALKDKKIEALLSQIKSSISLNKSADQALENNNVLSIAKVIDGIPLDDNLSVLFDFKRIKDKDVKSCIKESLILHKLYCSYPDRLIDWTAPMILITKAYESFLRFKLSKVPHYSKFRNKYKSLGQLINYLESYQKIVQSFININDNGYAMILSVGKDVYNKYRNGYVHNASQKMKKQLYEEMIELLNKENMFYW